MAAAGPGAEKPVVATRIRSRSLGTMAMAHQEQQQQQQPSYDRSANHPDNMHQSWFPPPSTAPIHERQVAMRETPKPLEQLPPIFPVSPISPDAGGLYLHQPAPQAPPARLLVPPSPAFSEEGPRSPLLERVRSKRRTVLSRIEGWWDLNLIEKRQTLFGGRKVT